LGTLIVLHESLVSVATMVREMETGTVEQLLKVPVTMNHAGTSPGM